MDLIRIILLIAIFTIMIYGTIDIIKNRKIYKKEFKEFWNSLE